MVDCVASMGNMVRSRASNPGANRFVLSACGGTRHLSHDGAELTDLASPKTAAPPCVPQFTERILVARTAQVLVPTDSKFSAKSETKT